MKKRLIILSAILCLVLAGCSSSNDSETSANETSTETSDSQSEDTETSTDTDSTAEAETETEDPTPVVDTTVSDEGIDKFITLGEYKGLELTQNAVSVTEEEIESNISSALTTYAAEVEDGTVEDGDIVNIDYEGKVDDEAFDGGTSEGYDLTIGSGSFIDGFEDQLVGSKTGDTVEVNVTFPDDYSSEDVAGKDAVFTVTINSIKRPDAEISDEWVEKNSDYKTVEEYRESIKKDLEESYEASELSTLQSEAFNMVLEDTTFLQYPQEMVDEYSELIKSSYEQYATYYGMEYDEFLSAAGISDVTLANQAKSNVKTALIVDAICELEGIDTDSDTYKERLDQTIEENGFESYDAAIESGATESDIERTVKYYCALDAIINNANITEVAETEAEDAVVETEGTTETEAESDTAETETESESE